MIDFDALVLNWIQAGQPQTNFRLPPFSRKHPDAVWASRVGECPLRHSLERKKVPPWIELPPPNPYLLALGHETQHRWLNIIRESYKDVVSETEIYRQGVNGHIDIIVYKEPICEFQIDYLVEVKATGLKLPPRYFLQACTYSYLMDAPIYLILDHNNGEFEALYIEGGDMFTPYDTRSGAVYTVGNQAPEISRQALEDLIQQHREPEPPRCETPTIPKCLRTEKQSKQEYAIAACPYWCWGEPQAKWEIYTGTKGETKYIKIGDDYLEIAFDGWGV